MKPENFNKLMYFWMVFCIILLIGGLYVGIHFIRKYW